MTQPIGNVTWPQWRTIFAFFFLSGCAIDLPFALYGYLRGQDFLWFVKIGLGAVMGLLTLFGVAVVSALGAVLMCVPVLLLRRFMPRAPVVIWMVLCCVSAAVIGLLGRLMESWLPTICAAVAGLGIGWWYRTRVIGKETAASSLQEPAA